ncbi:rod shape-determining protein MreC [Arsenophonus symbiont of Ornithomya chloropus]|uniref:rod shape-determining protein MreC n=1 Tax=Arsenophonus symbiont of Ornithomya chloropus TaxID=634121 RepID=UPI0032B25495
MKPIFIKRLSIKIRVIIALFFATVIFFCDRSNTFNKFRSYLEIPLTPLYFLINFPREFLDNISDTFTKQKQLLFENHALKKEILLKKADNLLFEQIKEENAKLRTLLGSPLRQRENMMVTQVLSGLHTPYRDQIMIDKGLYDDVYEGQPVISDKGVVGQVISVSQFNSRVLLICDITHALPIQILRNDIRVIAAGAGCSDDLQLEPVPDNTDIRIGDVIVTSGLGGRFPEGYPVAIVSSVKYDFQRAYMIIRAKPSADLQRLRYLLLLLGSSNEVNNSLSASEAYKVANEPLINIFPDVFSSKNEVIEKDIIFKNIKDKKINPP